MTMAIAFSSQNIVGKFLLGSCTTLIKNIKYKLIIKLITQMDGKSRDKFIKPK